MSYPNVELFPKRFIAGDELAIGPWTFDDYPASAWSLTWALVIAGSQLQLTAQESGDSFSLTVPSAFTAAFPAGSYWWQAYVTDVGGDRKTVGEGVVEVITDYDQESSGFDARSHIKKVLDAIEAVLEDRATKDQEGYTIAGRSLSRTPIEDLIKLKNKYKLLWDNELAEIEALKEGKNGKNIVETRFV